MTLRLDVPREVALHSASEIVVEAWNSFDEARPQQPPIGSHLRALLTAALPESPTAVLEVLEDARRALDQSIAQPRPRYFAFVASSGLEVGVLGDLLASCFDANMAVWAAAATEIEDQAIRWVAEFVGFPGGAGPARDGKDEIETEVVESRGAGGANRGAGAIRVVDAAERDEEGALK